jgi:hypothetical protein
MNTIKATYWIALATFALALNSGYQHGKFPGLHSFADHSESALFRISTGAERTLAMARFLTGRPVTPHSDDFAAAATEMEQAEADLDRERSEVRTQVQDSAASARKRMCAQAAMIRAQVQMQRSQMQLQRAQIEQIRSRVRSQVHISRTASRRLVVVAPESCREAGVRMAINAGPEFLADDESTF